MYFKPILLLNIFLYHFICDFRFRLVFLCTLRYYLQRHFSFTFAKHDLYTVDFLRDSSTTVSTWHELKGSTSFLLPVQNLCRQICLSIICVEPPYYPFSPFEETYQSDLLPDQLSERTGKNACYLLAGLYIFYNKFQYIRSCIMTNCIMLHFACCR